MGQSLRLPRHHLQRRRAVALSKVADLRQRDRVLGWANWNDSTGYTGSDGHQGWRSLSRQLGLALEFEVVHR